jgi:hypothetical protein
VEILDSLLYMVFSHHGTLRANQFNAYISIVAICIYMSPTTGETSNRVSRRTDASQASTNRVPTLRVAGT